MARLIKLFGQPRDALLQPVQAKPKENGAAKQKKEENVHDPARSIAAKVLICNHQMH